MIHGHGDDIYRFNGIMRVNFSTNIPNVRHIGLENHLASKIGIISHYPDPDATLLTTRLARISDVAAENIIVTAGAVDAIYSIARLHAGHRSTIVAPTFSEYADAATIYGHTVSYIDVANIGSANADIVWICNPNNPTGHVIPAKTLLDIAAAHPSILFVVDQAYEDYTLEGGIADSEAAATGNIIVLHSMTKRYHIPGLRIGYLAAPDAIADRLRDNRMPWTVNALAIEALDYALNHPDEFAIDTRTLIDEQHRLADALRRLGIDVMPSATNFLLARLPGGYTASSLKEWLVDDSAMLIRDASNFHGLTPGHFRVAVQSPSDNDNLTTAISRWLHRS